ncbi:proline-rich protein PRCC [Drosophila tropicalis]|uniref:proline-rich protein PRCC n=1 Tax=Drosophila tropicalis TaxID=46794 RepID=UPI0035AB7877
MSLVAYAASSDEDSENEEPVSSKVTESTNNHISDDDDDYVPQEVTLNQLKSSSGRFALALPKPKVSAASSPEEGDNVEAASVFATLPTPRSTVATAEEADDEFLHKKPSALMGSEVLEKPPALPIKRSVKISIPSLRDFSDVDKEMSEKFKSRKNESKTNTPKGSGLLSLLPQAKSERNFSKTEYAVAAQKPQTVHATTSVAASPFVPDTVKQRRAAHNTEAVDGVKNIVAPQKKPTTARPSATSLVAVSDSEDGDDDDDDGDFFSLNSKHRLPEVSSNEINALVAKRAARMAEASNKYLKNMTERQIPEEESQELVREEQNEHHLRQIQASNCDVQLNAEAMDALVGKNAKRRRKEAKGMQVIEISGSEVHPNREEWMRTALASSTTFQPTGVLTDEEPVAGTRRKHQITYLAHKAKANEAELQAMWSANRNTRRVTQSKYGF